MACIVCFGDGTVVDPDASAQKFFGWVEVPFPMCEGSGDMSDMPVWGDG